jgi:hypothetical protein
VRHWFDILGDYEAGAQGLFKQLRERIRHVATDLPPGESLDDGPYAGTGSTCRRVLSATGNLVLTGNTCRLVDRNRLYMTP